MTITKIGWARQRILKVGFGDCRGWILLEKAQLVNSHLDEKKITLARKKALDAAQKMHTKRQKRQPEL